MSRVFHFLSWISLVTVIIRVVNDFRDHYGWFREGQRYGDELIVAVGEYRNQFSIGSGRNLTQVEVLGLFMSNDDARRAIDESAGFSVDWIGHISQNIPGITINLYPITVGDLMRLNLQIRFASERSIELDERLKRDGFGFLRSDEWLDEE